MGVKSAENLERLIEIGCGIYIGNTARGVEEKSSPLAERSRGMMKIIRQKLLPGAVLTEFEDGSIDMLPYRVDENGEEYSEMFPNDIPANAGKE
jgi:hypothetical protein